MAWRRACVATLSAAASCCCCCSSSTLDVSIHGDLLHLHGMLGCLCRFPLPRHSSRPARAGGSGLRSTPARHWSGDFLCTYNIQISIHTHTHAHAPGKSDLPSEMRPGPLAPSRNPPWKEAMPLAWYLPVVTGRESISQIPLDLGTIGGAPAAYRYCAQGLQCGLWIPQYFSRNSRR